MNVLAALSLPSLALASSNVFDHAAQPRIAGGFPGGIGAYPFFCHAVTEESVCGGTLVAPDVVLTTKSCESVFKDNAVFIGSNDRLGRDFAPRIGVSSMLTHPTDDLMMVLLQETSPNALVSLNANPALPENQTLFTIGFGKVLDTDEMFSDDLLEVDMFLLENGICRLQVGNSFNETTQLCASFPFGGPCDGDEGGPLLDLITQVQYGVYSFNLGCTNEPSVFLRISSYTDWIHDFICSNSTLPPTDLCGDVMPENEDKGKGKNPKKSKKTKSSSSSSKKGGKSGKSGKGGKTGGKDKIQHESVEDETEDYFFMNSTHHYYNETHYHNASIHNETTSSPKSSSKKSSFKKGEQNDGNVTRTSTTHQQRNRRKRRQNQYPRIRGERESPAVM